MAIARKIGIQGWVTSVLVLVAYTTYINRRLLRIHPLVHEYSQITCMIPVVVFSTLLVSYSGSSPAEVFLLWRSMGTRLYLSALEEYGYEAACETLVMSVVMFH